MAGRLYLLLTVLVANRWKKLSLDADRLPNDLLFSPPTILIAVSTSVSISVCLPSFFKGSFQSFDHQNISSPFNWIKQFITDIITLDHAKNSQVD